MMVVLPAPSADRTHSGSEEMAWPLSLGEQGLLAGAEGGMAHLMTRSLGTGVGLPAASMPFLSGEAEPGRVVGGDGQTDEQTGEWWVDGELVGVGCVWRGGRKEA